MTLKQASAFSLAKAKTIYLAPQSSVFSVFHFMESWFWSSCCQNFSFLVFLCCGMWRLAVYTLNSYFQRPFILSQQLRSLYLDAWGTFFKSFGPRRYPTIQAALMSTASLCPSPYSVSFLGMSLFCPENSLFSFSLSLDSETLVAYGSCLMTYVQSWVPYTACPSSVLFSLSLSLCLRMYFGSLTACPLCSSFLPTYGLCFISWT